MAEDVAAASRAASSGCARRPARSCAFPGRCGPAARARAARRRSSIARALDLEAHERRQAAGSRALAIWRSVTPKRCHLVLRQVDALLARSRSRRPARKLISCRLEQIASEQARLLRLACAEQVQQQAADRVGRAAAIVHEFAEVGIALLGHVLGERPSRSRNRPTAGSFRITRCQAGEQRHGGGARSRSDRVPRETAPVAPAGRRRGSVAFVGEVVGLAGEGVDQPHGRPAGRQEHRGDREVLVMVIAIWGIQCVMTKGLGCVAKGVAALLDVTTGGVHYIKMRMRESGGIGRRTRFRFWRRKA